jgi:outer membrane protein assembly factor BamE (lipoprotein component of BamABCDE complex)
VQLSVAALRAVALGVLLPVGGCAIFGDSPHYRGIAVTQHDLNELRPGIATEADAQALLGPATVQEAFNQNNWIYISQITKMRIARTEGVNQQHVVVLSFDNNGVLQKVTQKNLDDAVQVAMNPNETPSPGGKPGFIRRLIGGVGSYNPLGGIMGGGASGFGGAGGAGGLGGGGL